MQTLVGCGPYRGKLYTDLSDLRSDLPDHVLMGRFDEAWPARVTQVQKSENGAAFSTSDGTRHSYPDYWGYEFMVIFLEADTKKPVIVMRSREGGIAPLEPPLPEIN